MASLFNSVDIKQEISPFYIGERANATGSKGFRQALLERDHEAAFQILVEQEEQGSHAADLSVAYAGLDELEDMKLLAARAAKECRLPLAIDSNDPEVVEAFVSIELKQWEKIRFETTKFMPSFEDIVEVKKAGKK